MRLGCGGCLVTVFVVALVAAVVGGSTWLVVRGLENPGIVAEQPTAADSSRAQRKIFDLANRGHRAGEQIVLTEREINALLSRQLAGELPFSSSVARLVGDGRIELAGQLPVRQLLAESPAAAVLDLIPEGWGRRPVWVHLQTRARVEPRGARRQLRLDVERFAIGRLPLPGSAVRVLFDPESLRFLRLPLPDNVDAVVIEPGRATIRIAS